MPVGNDGVKFRYQKSIFESVLILCYLSVARKEQNTDGSSKDRQGGGGFNFAALLLFLPLTSFTIFQLFVFYKVLNVGHFTLQLSGLFRFIFFFGALVGLHDTDLLIFNLWNSIFELRSFVRVIALLTYFVGFPRLSFLYLLFYRLNICSCLYMLQTS